MYKGFCATIGSLPSLFLATLGGIVMCCGVAGAGTLPVVIGMIVGMSGMTAGAYIEERVRKTLHAQKTGAKQGSLIMKKKQLGAYLLTTLSLTAAFKAVTYTGTYKDIERRTEAPLPPAAAAKHAAYITHASSINI